MYLLFFGPILLVVIAAIIWLACRRKPTGIRDCLVALSVVIFMIVSVPLFWGVWLPDLDGRQHTLCSATTSSGYRISIVQYWNNVDFYTTEARVTAPDGVISITLIDGDAAKSWNASLEIAPSQKSAIYRIPNGRTDTLTW